MGDLPKRLLSKQWQDRIRAYEELGELLVRETDSVARYAPYFKRIVADTANPRAQEAALATLVSVLTHLSSLRDPARACPPELRSQAADVSLALIEKCLAGRSTIKEKAIQALLLLAQIGALEPVLNQLLKGCQNKVAKVAASCLFCLKEAVRIFGSPPVSPEPILPVLKASFDHSVQEVRTEALLATVEFHAWLGSSFDASIQEMGLRPAQLKELEAAYEAKAAREPAPPTPERKILLSSGGKISTFQPKRLSISRDEDELARELESAAGDGSLSQDNLTVDESSGDASPVEVLVAGERGGEDEPRERKERSEARDAANLPPINLLSMLTPDWYREVTTGVWQKRKEQLDNMISWCGVPGQRLQPGDYTKLIKTLREMLADSTTTTVVAGSAIKAMGAVAKGLGRDFLPHARRLVPILLDDFKTKKTLVGAVIHDVLDEMHNSCFTISDITSEVGEGLAHKVPRVRSECLKWISRCVANTQGATVTNLGPLSELLLKCVDDSQAEVRHAAYSVISLLSKYHGDAFTQELSEGDLDRARLTKLKESTRAGSFGSAASPGGKGSSGGGGSAAPSPSAAPRTPSSAARPRSLSRPTERKDSGGASLNNVGAGNGSNGDASSPYSTPSRGSAAATPTPTTPTSVPNRTSATRPASLNLNPPSSSSSSPSPAPSQLLSSYPSQSVKASNSSFSSSQNGAAANGEEANHLLAPLNYSPSPSSLSSTDSPVGKAREGLSALRAGLARQLEALEQRLEEAEARSAEDHLFAADMHAWNLQLVEQQKADQQRIKELEEACRTAEEERAATGAGREYLPGPEELSAMTRDDLTELERRQEEYLLTIRKIKISLIR